MSNAQGPLPEFNAPPVSEVALAVTFTPLEKWRSAHAGLYWALIDGEYPSSEEKPPIPSLIEQFGDEGAGQIQQNFHLNFTMDPEMTRSWFITDSGNYLIQVQRDRFIVNWRRVRADDVYPRYDIEIRSRFEKEWKVFKKFVTDRKLGSFNIRQCEVTYINDFAKGTDWTNFSEALKLFSQWLGGGSDNFLPPPESLTIASTFAMPEKRGRLHFQTQRVLRQRDLAEVLQANLMARGKPASDSDADVLDWLDFGRQWVVRGFADLTSSYAHKLWGRTI